MRRQKKNSHYRTGEARVVAHPPERGRHEVSPVLLAEPHEDVDLVEDGLVPVTAPGFVTDGRTGRQAGRQAKTDGNKCNAR